MASVVETRELSIKGTRTIAVELTTRLHVAPTALGLLRTGVGTGANIAILWFNIISLKVAYHNLQKSDALEYTLGFAASIFGVIAAAAAALVSTRSMHMAVMTRLRPSAPGLAFGSGIIKAVSSPLFARIVGYPAIGLGLLSDYQKSERQRENGDSVASRHTLSAGAMMSLGSIVILETGIGLAASSSAIPGVGWIPAALFLIGAGLVAGSLSLYSKAHERIHTPIELWAARSTFGNRLNDGEIRHNINLDNNKKLPNFITPQEESKAWHLEHFRPFLLSEKDALTLGIANVDTARHLHAQPGILARGTTTLSRIVNAKSTVQFTVLLPGFLIGSSTWSASLTSTKRNDDGIFLPLNPICHVVKAGLIINFKNEIFNQRDATLKITYSPGQGLADNIKIDTKFLLES